MTKTLVTWQTGHDMDDMDDMDAMATVIQDLREKLHAQETLNRRQSEFLANLSHELRNPLNSLLVLARLLASNEEGNLTTAQAGTAHVIHESGLDLLRIVNDILDLARMEAGRMEVCLEEKSVNDFCCAIEQMFRPVAELKGLIFNMELAKEVPSSVRSDWVKIEQVIRNLLSNALKFTLEGHITVRVTQPDSDCLAITVADTGIGIPADLHEQIFEAFRQADGSTSRKYGGTGLGLSISRHLASLMGGTIQVDSIEGNGSSFTLFLPVPARRGMEHSPSTDHHPEPASPFIFMDPSMGILIVDDDRRNLFALKQMLNDKVGLVLTASSGQQALAMLDEYPDIDLVLMDIMMPEMDGFATMQKIRAQPRFKRLPIMALTARVMPEDRDRCLQAGASAYLAKPVQTDKLMAALASWVGNMNNIEKTI
ncbi:MAG: response regulator [Magnetococcales bacterium]|nr:response regulator [Magnetococcales bacterium]